MCLLQKERESERERGEKKKNVSGEMPPTSHKRHLSVTSPKDVLVQAVLKGRHFGL